VMAAVNLVFVTRATAADARVALAIARALGASPAESATGLAVAQIVPAAVGLVTGVASGILLYHALAVSHPVTPSVATLVGLALVTMLAVCLLTAVPARLEARRPIADLLRDA
jgi:putative ABC transport system permease protein